MKRSWRTPVIESCAVALCALFVFLSVIGLTPVLNGDEARFVQASREMLHHHEWIVPSVAGNPRYEKPVLIYWLTAGSLAAFGDHPAAARWPSALAASLAVGLLAWRARSALGPGAGWTAGLLLAAGPVFFFEGRTCTADAVNLLWTLVAMLLLERLVTGRPSTAAALGFWVASGLAVLTKGPVAPLFIIGTGLAWWALQRRWSRWTAITIGLLVLVGALGLGPWVLLVPAAMAATDFIRDPDCRSRVAALRAGWGVPLFGIVVLPWVFAAWRATSGDFFSVAVGRHVLGRSLAAMESHGGFPGFYLLTALIVCFPWFSTAVAAVRRRLSERLEAGPTLFLLAWALGPLVVLETVQTRMVHYWLPAYPALVLLAVGFLRSTSDPWSRTRTGLHLLGGLGLAAVPVLPAVGVGIPEFEAPAVAMSLFMLGITGAAAVFAHRHPARAVLISAAGSLVFLALLFGPFLGALSDHLIGTRMTEVARRSLGSGRQIALFSLKDEEVLCALPVGIPVFETPEEVTHFLGGDGERIILARRSSFERLQKALQNVRLRVIEPVEGLDLGRGRWVEGVAFNTDKDRGPNHQRSAVRLR